MTNRLHTSPLPVSRPVQSVSVAGYTAVIMLINGFEIMRQGKGLSRVS